MSKTATQIWTRGNRVVGYDPKLRRLWIGGQRLHHGVTGIAVLSTGVARLLTRRGSNGAALWALAGGAMIAHDWKDRALWFKRGPQGAG
jgi:hypothetical protein